jgi:hypothetical protein
VQPAAHGFLWTVPAAKQRTARQPAQELLQDRKNERGEQRQLARRNAASHASIWASACIGGGRGSGSRVSRRAVCPGNCEFLATTVGQLAAWHTASTRPGEKDWKTTR